MQLTQLCVAGFGTKRAEAYTGTEAIMSAPEDALAHAVRDSLSAVFGNMQTTLERESDLSYRIEVGALRIFVGYSLTYIDVRAQSVREDSDPATALELFWVLEAVAPGVSENETMPKPLSIGRTVRDEVVRQLRLVLRYCSGLVADDPGSWTAVNRWMTDYGGRRRRSDETQSDFLARMKQTAVTAWMNGEFWKTADFYTRFRDCGGKMNLSDRWRLLLASLRTFRLP